MAPLQPVRTPSGRLTIVRSALAAVLLATSAGCGSPGPDLILVNGTLLTVDADDRVAEALAVTDGRITAVGTTEEIEALAGPRTERIDLDGRTATPGLLDAHAHFGWGGADMLYVLDLSYPQVENLTDVVRLVRSQVERRGAGAWIEGRGWDEGKLDERRYIYATDLDSVTPANPVWLSHTMGHYGVANSIALERAGITAGTPDPPGGTIDRYPDGRPTGVLKESAQGLVRRLMPDPTPEQQREGIRALARAFNAEGMTGLKDPGITPATWQAYRDVLDAGDLTVRVFALWSSPGSVEEARAWADSLAPFTRPYVSRPDDRLISGGVKLYVDGSGGARTAWVYQPWSDRYSGTDGDNRGYPATDPDVLREQIRVYHDAGLHVSVHSIGDRGIDWVVDSYQQALEANPVPGLRHGIIHANIPTNHALDVIAALQRDYDAAYPEPSATFMWWIGDTYAGNFGPERVRRLNPFRTFHDRGILWANGSDYTVTPFPARYGLWASVARRPLLGVYGDQPYGTDESVNVRIALRAQTIWAAHQMFLEDRIGSLEVGKYADLAVWEQNPYTVPPEQLRDLTAVLTLLGGQIVYRRPPGM